MTNDEMLRLAAESVLIRAGEAVSRIERSDPTYIATHQTVELRNLKDARNVIAHGDDIVDPEIVWAIMSVHLPRVVSKVTRLLDDDQPS